MSYFSRVNVNTATVGTGAVVPGAAISNAWCSLADAGVLTGAVCTWMLLEGTDFQIFKGTWNGTNVSRDTTYLSKIAGVAGASSMSLAGAATLLIVGASEDFRARSLITQYLLNSHYLSELSTGRINVVDGIVDPLKATTDVDVAGAINLDSSVAGQLSPTATTATDQTATHTANTTAGNTASASSILSTSYDAWHAFDKVTGGVSSGNTWLTNAVPTGWLQYQFGTAKTIASYSIRSANSYDTRAPKNWTLKGSNTGAFGGEETTLDTRTNVTAWATGGEVRTYTIASPASFTYYRLDVTANNGDASYLNIDEVTLSTAAITYNLTVRSAAFTAGFTPPIARLAAIVNPVDAITINTDLIGKITRDGGTTYTTVTFVLIATLADGTKLYVADNVSIAGQPSGTSMRWRIETVNAKMVQIKSVSLEWMQ